MMVRASAIGIAQIIQNFRLPIGDAIEVQIFGRLAVVKAEAEDVRGAVVKR
jgi:hypothetical protein